jgi:hypothetical protein
MTRRQSTLMALALGTMLVTAPVLGAQSQQPRQDPKPAPEVTAITPNDLVTAPKPRAMAITGRYFQDGLALSVRTPGGAVMEYKGTAITDRRDTSFNALVTMADVGPYEFVVVNPDGRTSSPFKLQVRAASLLPVVTGVKPATLAKNVSPQTITVDGQRFMAGLTAMVTDPAGNVQTIPSPDISQVLPESFQITLPLELSGSYEIIVKNPDGAVSKTFTFSVQR